MEYLERIWNTFGTHLEYVERIWNAFGKREPIWNAFGRLCDEEMGFAGAPAPHDE